jgi:hypothetical protein
VRWLTHSVTVIFAVMAGLDPAIQRTATTVCALESQLDARNKSWHDD